MAAEEEPFSLQCFNCNVCSGFAATTQGAEAIARAEGWVLGIDPDSGSIDAFYACPDCADLLIDTVSV